MPAHGPSERSSTARVAQGPSADGASSFHHSGPRAETTQVRLPGRPSTIMVRPPRIGSEHDRPRSTLHPSTPRSGGPRPPTSPRLGGLRQAGWTSLSVADEIRRNASARIAAGEPLVTGVLGFDDTVLPQLENAVLAGHDVILLGERGQAKTRIIRSLVGLLDEWLPDRRALRDQRRPVPPGLPVRQGPGWPRRATTCRWHGSTAATRYGEKLATPDTSIADLIGEVDPIKVAEGRYLSDELTIHYGLVPAAQPGHLRHQRAPRPGRADPGRPAQRARGARRADPRPQGPPAARHRAGGDGQPRGLHQPGPDHHPAEGPLRRPDPHPLPAATRRPSCASPRLEADLPGGRAGPAPPGLPQVEIPAFMAEIVAELSQLARQSPHLNQRSGVSVRLTIANYETLVANATRRALRNGESEAVPRITDLESLVSSTQGKVEIESLEEGREEVDPRPAGRRPRCCSSSAAGCTSSRAAGRGRRLHRGHRGPRRRRPPGRRLRRDPRPDAGALGAGPGPDRRVRGPRPWWPAPSSSCSRGCT